jgi:hypothetical protein
MSVLVGLFCSLIGYFSLIFALASVAHGFICQCHTVCKSLQKRGGGMGGYMRGGGVWGVWMGGMGGVCAVGVG